MRSVIKELKQLIPLKRKHHHPLIHKLHKKYGISRKTLFYMKEYGPHTHVPRTIIRESLKILLFASIISSIGGLSAEYVKTLFISITPLIILLPALNDMIGDFGTIISAKFSTMLHENEAKGELLKSKPLNKLFLQIMFIAVVTSVISAVIALVSANLSGYASSMQIASKIFLISILDTLLLVTLIFFVAIFAGLHFYNKGEDPNNFLIPITTSIADFGNIILLSILVIILF